MKPINAQLIALLTVCFGAITTLSAQTSDFSQSVLVQSEAAKPVLQEPAPPTLTAASPQSTLELTAAQPPLELTAPQAVLVPMSMPVASTMGHAGCCDECCRPCSKRRRCCPPPVPTNFCLVDPCGCTHEACIEVPACCCGEQPCIEWRSGVLGRQVATLCWECCGFEAKVIVTRKGKVRVRD